MRMAISRFHHGARATCTIGSMRMFAPDVTYPGGGPYPGRG